MSNLYLKISTPVGVKGPFECDSVHLSVCDDKSGKGGGCYGVHFGHADAVLALREGKIEAFLKTDKIFSAVCRGGFATVGKDFVTAVVEKCEEVKVDAK